MSLRDDPESHKIIVPRVAGLNVIRAYDPNSGGIGGPGKDRVSVDGEWVTHGDDPLTRCDKDAETDRFLIAHWDASKLDTLILRPIYVPPGTPEEEVPKFQREVDQWLDRSGKNRTATAITWWTHRPRLVRNQPFFPAAVDFRRTCDVDDPEAEPEEDA